MNPRQREEMLQIELASVRRRLEEAERQQESLYTCASQAVESGLEVFGGSVVTDHGTVDVILRPPSQTIRSSSGYRLHRNVDRTGPMLCPKCNAEHEQPHDCESETTEIDCKCGLRLLIVLNDESPYWSIADAYAEGS